MAVSKSGGSRSFLRGRIANDVYSIGKDGKGKKQQVVRSLAETVANPQTTAQMRGRMIMSTVMQAVSGLSQLIDHSFDGVAVGQPSLSEFIRRNYKLVKEDATAHPSNGNSFGLVKYQEKGAKAGLYVVASGKAVKSSAIEAAFDATASLKIKGLPAGFTAKQLRDALGLAIGDYITRVAILANGEVVFFRVEISDKVAADTAISAANVADAFVIDNPFGLSITPTFSASEIDFTVTGVTATAVGTIVSIATASGWMHNDETLVIGDAPEFTADVALETYPRGSQKFLNGGELYGAASGTTGTTDSDDDTPTGGDDTPTGGGGSGNGD